VFGTLSTQSSTVMRAMANPFRVLTLPTIPVDKRSTNNLPLDCLWTLEMGGLEA
jgi:hypothetical protein